MSPGFLISALQSVGVWTKGMESLGSERRVARESSARTRSLSRTGNTSRESHTLTSAPLPNKGEAGLLTREQNSHQQLRCGDGSGAISSPPQRPWRERAGRRPRAKLSSQSRRTAIRAATPLYFFVAPVTCPVDRALAHKALKLFIRTQPQHLFAATGCISLAQIEEHNFEQGLEFERGLRRKHSD